MLEALGLQDKKLRSLTIRLAVDEVVTANVAYEEFVEADRLQLVSKTFEIAKWIEVS